MSYSIHFSPRSLLMSCVITSSLLLSQSLLAKGATEHTRNANQKVLSQLPFEDRAEFDDAARGLLYAPTTLILKNPEGRVIWDLDSYKSFIQIDLPAPDSVNPSLWRNAQLNMHAGLYEVIEGIYQVRGYDLANITFLSGKKGWVVLDAGSTMETAQAALSVVNATLGERPVTAVIYSHPHLDHYSGVKGLVNEEDVKRGKVAIIAPEGFLEHAVSEGVIAGNAMSRRATYMYGALLPRNGSGSVGAGLGITNPLGTGTLIAPTKLVQYTGEKIKVDGIEMVFQMTPGTEAPAEMNIYLPRFKAMWMAENTTSTMHNILTPRGAQVRDALAWSKYIDETIALYGDDIELTFQSHHWPKWGKERVIDYLSKQRDLYKFIHDRSVNLLNKGYTGEEIAEKITLPKSLENFWPGRGYYGTLRHNSRAVYQRYMGWYDGNPSSLNNLPVADSAAKYVRYMGGEAAVIQKAKRDFEEGEYRWVASVLRHVVFANPNNKEAKELLADAYEQLGFQAESGPWRSIYLQGAYELRHGVPEPKSKGGSASPDVIRAMPMDMLLDYLAVRIDAVKAEHKKLSIQLVITDLKEEYFLWINNAVLNFRKQKNPGADVTVHISKHEIDNISLGLSDFKQLQESGQLRIQGDENILKEFFSLLETFPQAFPIVTP